MNSKTMILNLEFDNLPDLLIDIHDLKRQLKNQNINNIKANLEISYSDKYKITNQFKHKNNNIYELFPSLKKKLQEVEKSEQYKFIIVFSDEDFKEYNFEVCNEYRDRLIFDEYIGIPIIAFRKSGKIIKR